MLPEYLKKKVDFVKELSDVYSNTSTTQKEQTTQFLKRLLATTEKENS